MQDSLSRREVADLTEVALRHGQTTECLLRDEGHSVVTVAFTGALILARAAFFAHMNQTGKALPYRQLAHKILAEALDEAELIMTQCEGRA